MFKSINKIIDKFKPQFLKTIQVENGSKNEAKLLDFSVVKAAILSNDLNKLMGIYQKVLNCDLNISGKLENRKDALLSLPFTIECEKKEQVIIENILEEFDIEGLLKSIANDMYYGISLNNIVYEIKDNLILPISFKPIMPTLLNEDTKDKKEKLYFSQTDDKKLYLDTIDPNRLIVHHHKIDNASLQNSSIAYKLLWSAILKHTIITLNLEYFDKAAVPPLIVKVDDLSDTKKADELFKQMMELKSTSVGLFGQDTEIETLKFDSKADFEKSINYIDKKINEFIIGGNLSSSSEGVGSQALGRVHESRLFEKVKADSKVINKTISVFLNQVLSLNLENHTPVKFRFTLPDQTNHEEQEIKSKVIQNLTSSGYVVPTEHISKTFGIENITFKETPDKSNNSVLELNKIMGDGLETRALEDEVLGYMANIMNECNSYDELLDKLLEQYQFIELNKLEDILVKDNLRATIEGSLKVGNDATD